MEHSRNSDNNNNNNNNNSNYNMDLNDLWKLDNPIVFPDQNSRNILITSALPYVNNVPHLGNIIGSVLSADVYSRHCKQLDNVRSIFICGTDEYGTATETAALENKVKPQEICDKYNSIHKKVYDWFLIGFDHFGRTTNSSQTPITQGIFEQIRANNFIEEQKSEQLYCIKDERFLADRFVEGECPYCGYLDARGDQCDKCTKLLNPIDLINPKCKICSSTPEFKETKHLYLKLDELSESVKKWFDFQSVEGRWSANAISVTNAWFCEGLKPRAITRDLKWGTPLPACIKDYENKVFYVWFDATIGYISITADYCGENWRKWWSPSNNENVELVQFMGKDNIPFHTIVFPASLIATKSNWLKLSRISTTEYLTYESNKFSKSRKYGVFGDQVQDAKLPTDIWRYYLISIRPESGDSDFSWDNLRSKVNSDLADNIGNLVSRVLKFLVSNYNSIVPEHGEFIEIDLTLIEQVNQHYDEYLKKMENIELRGALREVLCISRAANEYLQVIKPWKIIGSNEKIRCNTAIYLSVSILKIIAITLFPYTPGLSSELMIQLGFINDEDHRILKERIFNVAEAYKTVFRLPKSPFPVNIINAGHIIGEPKVLVEKIKEQDIKIWKSLYSGKLREDSENVFELDLRVGKIVKVDDLDKESESCYIMDVLIGENEIRRIIAGIKSFYSREDLENKTVVVLCNIKEVKIRGQTSQGMLLSVIKNNRISLLTTKNSMPGTQILPENYKLKKVLNKDDNEKNINAVDKGKRGIDKKKIKGMPFKIMINKILFFGVPLLAGNEDITILDEGKWEGGIIQ